MLVHNNGPAISRKKRFVVHLIDVIVEQAGGGVVLESLDTGASRKTLNNTGGAAGCGQTRRKYKRHGRPARHNSKRGKKSPRRGV